MKSGAPTACPPSFLFGGPHLGETSRGLSPRGVVPPLLSPSPREEASSSSGQGRGVSDLKESLGDGNTALGSTCATDVRSRLQDRVIVQLLPCGGVFVLSVCLLCGFCLFCVVLLCVCVRARACFVVVVVVIAFCLFVFFSVCFFDDFS